MKVWVLKKEGPHRSAQYNKYMHINVYAIVEVVANGEDEERSILKTVNTGSSNRYTVEGNPDDIVAQIEKQILEDKLQAVPDNVNVTVKTPAKPDPKAKK